MITDEDGKVVYTIVPPESKDEGTKTAATTLPNLPADRTPVSFKVVQGVATEYTVNGERLITANNLDSHRRLYFNEINVAENGIYICNADKNGEPVYNYNEWERRENIASEQFDQKIYQFGVQRDGNACYIEFPEDVQSLFGQGIFVTYLLSDGKDGTIQKGVLDKFYGDPSWNVFYNDGSSDSDAVDMNENIYITNDTSKTSGKEPETIDEAYRGYTKTTGTFDTLVTLRDYINAIYNSELVSNGFVCDRTNDIQSSWRVLTLDGDVERKVLMVNETNGKEDINAFGLKLYLLNKFDDPTTPSAYRKTFEMLKNFGDDKVDPAVKDVQDYIEDEKCIQHDFIPLQEDKLLFIKCYYPITCKIIPQYRVTVEQAVEIRSNVIKALYKNYCSRKVEFGEAVDYDKLYECIMGADDRIKAIVLDDITYTAKGVYFRNIGNGYQFIERDIPNIENSSSSADIYAKSVLNGNTQFFVPDTPFDIDFTQNGEITEGVASISTEVQVDLADSSPYVIKSNEGVIFCSENAVEMSGRVYGSGIKIQYYIAKSNPNSTDVETIEAGSVFQLGSNDFIYACRRDDDDSLYQYFYHGAGCIIKTGIRLYRGADDNYKDIINAANLTEQQSFADDGNGVYGTGYLNQQQTDKVANTWDKSIGSNRVNVSVTASKTISQVSKNSVTIEQPYQYYFITNKTVSVDDDTYYELDFSTLEGEKFYIMQSGEYFLYRNSDASVVNMLSAGTKISVSGDVNSLVCKHVPVEDVMQNESSISSMWQTISGFTLTATEMQVVSLNGVGGAVRATNISSTIFLQNSWSKIPSSATIELKEPNGGYTGLPYTVPGCYWIGRSTFNIDVSPKNPIKIFKDEPEDPEKRFIAHIYMYDKNGELLKEVNTGGETPIEEDTYIQTDYNYSLVGGDNIPVVRQDINGNSIYARVFVYTVDPTNTFVNSPTISADVPTGNYILPIKTYSDSVGCVITHRDYVTLNDGDPDHVEHSDSTTLIGNKTHYILLRIQSGDSIEISGTYGTDYTCGDMQKVVYPDGIDNSRTRLEIIRKLRSLQDDNKNQYNYTHIVDERVEIPNPTIPEGFLNQNHIFNKFTICQMDVGTDLGTDSKVDIQVTNVAK